MVAVAAFELDWSLGRVFTKTLPAGPGTSTFTFSNPVTGKSIMVILTQDAATARSVDWPAAVLWEGGTEIEMSTTLSCKAVFSFVYDGTNYIGTCVNDAQ